MRNGLTQKECEAESVFMIVAGADTTASAIRTTMLHLMATPLVYLRFKQVIAKTVREGRASNPITNEEAQTIPYLRVGLSLLFLFLFLSLLFRPATHYFQED